LVIAFFRFGAALFFLVARDGRFFRTAFLVVALFFEIEVDLCLFACSFDQNLHFYVNHLKFRVTSLIQANRN